MYITGKRHMFDWVKYLWVRLFGIRVNCKNDLSLDEMKERQNTQKGFSSVTYLVTQALWKRDEE